MNSELFPSERCAPPWINAHSAVQQAQQTTVHKEQIWPFTLHTIHWYFLDFQDERCSCEASTCFWFRVKYLDGVLWNCLTLIFFKSCLCASCTEVLAPLLCYTFLPCHFLHVFLSLELQSPKSGGPRREKPWRTPRKNISIRQINVNGLRELHHVVIVRRIWRAPSCSGP